MLTSASQSLLLQKWYITAFTAHLYTPLFDLCNVVKMSAERSYIVIYLITHLCFCARLSTDFKTNSHYGERGLLVGGPKIDRRDFPQCVWLCWALLMHTIPCVFGYDFTYLAILSPFV